MSGGRYRWRVKSYVLYRPSTDSSITVENFFLTGSRKKHLRKAIVIECKKTFPEWIVMHIDYEKRNVEK